MKMVSRTTQITLLPEGEPIYSEMATEVSIEDEAGSEFVVISQSGRSDMGTVAIAPEEWPAIRDAVEKMIANCRAAPKEPGA